MQTMEWFGINSECHKWLVSILVCIKGVVIKGHD